MKVFPFASLHALLAMLALLGWTASGQAQTVLPDTGQDTCYNNTTADSVAATSPSSIAVDTGTHPRQDCRYGADAAGVANVNYKTGGGAKGFDYTKISNGGKALANDATLGTASGEWACTRDNLTGLTWEVKVSDLNALRDGDWYYTWYNADPEYYPNNNGLADTGLGHGSDGCDDPGRCDTAKYVEDVNISKLCGYTDWRLPTVRELLTLIHAGTGDPTIDQSYFPNMYGVGYWTSSSYASDTEYAWTVDFYYGSSSRHIKTDTHSPRHVLLVRGTRF